MRLRDLGGLIVIDFIDMEDSKNQRAVENRLRDALHFDRARVQMGKISRFGLMELSRQRLRPALNEGSHVTCPRCNGTGVIRDAESSALHVLRLLQEEAMKENTAAVHAQVPVDVATFLLNEKRADITKIEARLKVNLILIPNKHLETPHHHIERLRHDDPRLEDLKTSFNLVDAPSTDMSWAPKEQEVKAKPEALVKGITPSQPAPVSAPAPVAQSQPAKADDQPGFFKRLMGWLTGSSETKPAAAPPPATETTSAEKGPRRQGDRRQGRGNNGRGRRSDNRAEGRQDGRNETRGSSAESQETPRRQVKPTRDEDQGALIRVDQQPESDDNAPRGNGRNRRGRGRQRREEGVDIPQDQATSALPSGVDSQSAAVSTAAGVVAAAAGIATTINVDATLKPDADQPGSEDLLGTDDDQDQADPERKRRRRRSRRGRRGSDDQVTSDLQSTMDPDAADHASRRSDEAPVVAAAEGVTAPAALTPVAVATPAFVPVEPPPAPVLATSIPEPARTAVAPVAVAPTEVAPVAVVPTEVAPATVAPVTVAPVVVPTVETAPVMTPAAAQQITGLAQPLAQTVTTQPVSAETGTTSMVTAVTAPANVESAKPIILPVADKSSLIQMVKAVGLQWVETDPVRAAQANSAISFTPIKLGREPKPVVQASNAPLVQVETRG